VAIDGDTIVVGAEKDTTGVGMWAGSAYVFTRTGGVWSQQDHLYADDAVAGDQFGNTVAISGDTIVVGARYDDTAAGSLAGSAYVFTRSGGTWSQQAHLYADDAVADDRFGDSVAMDGDTIVVGAQYDDVGTEDWAGSAYVFTRTGGSWSQQDHLYADAPVTQDRFGDSVAIDGDTIFVGASGVDTATVSNLGSVFVFTRAGATWNRRYQLFADDGAESDLFGRSVAIDGDTSVVGANHDDTAGGSMAGSAYVFAAPLLRVFLGIPES
jgi:hypothetical protein